MVDKGTKYAKYTDSSWDEPAYIPGGYCVVNDSTTDTDNARKVNTIANGLVISDLANDTLDNEINEDGKQGNQFVWVPVPEITSMYDETNKAGKLYDYGTYNSSTSSWTALSEPKPRAYPTIKNSGNREPDVVTSASESDSTTGKNYDAVTGNLNIITDFTVEEGQIKTATLFKDYLQKEFDKMIESVKKYKGFYIGRYETSGVSDSNVLTVPTVKRGGTVGGGRWYYQYQEIKNMTQDNNNVTSSMIWGCQWDRTLNWFIETETSIEEIVDPKTWGNCKNSIGDAATSRGHIQASGTNIAWQKNHIYDLAGNAYDMTMEASSTSTRVIRGGCYNISSPAHHRSGHSPSLIGSESYGSRSTLYINL